MGFNIQGLFGYGFIISYKKYEEIFIDSYECESDIEEPEFYEELKKRCKEKNLDIKTDMYHPYDIFIGKIFYSAMNGSDTYNHDNGFNSEKDFLTSEQRCVFDINKEDYEKVNEFYKNISKFNEKMPRWLIFTYKD